MVDTLPAPTTLDESHRLAQAQLQQQVGGTIGQLVTTSVGRSPAIRAGYAQAAGQIVTAGQYAAANWAAGYMTAWTLGALEIYAPYTAVVAPTLSFVLQPLYASAINKSVSGLLRLWHLQDQGMDDDEARATAAAYASNLAEGDLHAAQRAGLDAVAGITGEDIRWRKVAGPTACDWCQAIASGPHPDRYFTASTVPIHTGISNGKPSGGMCRCGVAPGPPEQAIDVQQWLAMAATAGDVIAAGTAWVPPEIWGPDWLKYAGAAGSALSALAPQAAKPGWVRYVKTAGKVGGYVKVAAAQAEKFAEVARAAQVAQAAEEAAAQARTVPYTAAEIAAMEESEARLLAEIEGTAWEEELRARPLDVSFDTDAYHLQREWLSPSQLDAIRNYTGLDYEPMNSRLRMEILGRLPEWEVEQGEWAQVYARNTQAMIDAFRDTPHVTSSRGVVYRGIRGDYYNGAVGDIIREAGFLSATPERLSTLAFGPPIEITVPEGKEYLLGLRSEREVIFGPAQRLRIDEVDANGRPTKMTML